MDQAKLDFFRQQLRSRMPLVGNWLNGQALKSLAEEGSAEAIRVLEETVIEGDESLRSQALDILRRLAESQQVPAQEALCRLVIQHGHPLALELVHNSGYQPHDESTRALFYFLTDQWPAYEALDFDHRLLRQAYDVAPPELRSRIAAKARQAGRVEWVDMVSGGKRGRRLAFMSDDEWRAALKVLEAHGRFADLWRLAQEAPPNWSARILRRLKRARWRPAKDEQPVFSKLTRLARGWRVQHARRCFYERATLSDHNHEIRCLVISPDSTILASGSADHTVRLWSLPEGRPLSTLASHTSWIHCLALSPNGRTLASAGRDRRICLWSLPDGRLLGKLKGHTQAVRCLAISPDSTRLISGGADGVIWLWSLPDGEQLGKLNGHEAGVTCLALSGAGNLLASGGADSAIRLWSLPDGRALKTLTAHRDAELDGVLCLAMSSDGRLLVSGGTDSQVLVWRLPGGKLLQSLKGHSEPISALVLSPSGKLLVTGAGDHAVRLWRLPGGRLLETFHGQTSGTSALAISPDDRVLACGSGGGVAPDHHVRLWDLRSREGLRTLAGHSRYVSCLAWSPDSLLLASGSGDSTIRLWSAELVRLGQLPIAHTSLQDLQWVEATLDSADLQVDERVALAFLAALMRWRHRLDILVDEATPRTIELGAFDIELEG